MPTVPDTLIAVVAVVALFARLAVAAFPVILPAMGAVTVNPVNTHTEVISG